MEHGPSCETKRSLRKYCSIWWPRPRALRPGTDASHGSPHGSADAGAPAGSSRSPTNEAQIFCLREKERAAASFSLFFFVTGTQRCWMRPGSEFHRAGVTKGFDLEPNSAHTFGSLAQNTKRFCFRSAPDFER